MFRRGLQTIGRHICPLLNINRSLRTEKPFKVDTKMKIGRYVIGQEYRDWLLHGLINIGQTE